MKRTVIGPKMAEAVRIVRENPGCTKKFVAERISPCPRPSQNWAYGYDPINRAIRAGLIVGYAGKGNAFSLEVSGEPL